MAIWLIRCSREKRNMEAAKRFFKQAVAVVGSVPDQVTTDGHTSYPRAIRETMGSNVQHRTSNYLTNGLEQDHRGIRTAVLPNAWFWNRCARRHASVVTRDELRNYLRPRRTMGEVASLLEQRQAFLQPLVALQTLIQAA
jgi:putative transposase